MATFLVLGNWTEQGIRNVVEAPNRIKTTHSIVEKAGGKMQLFYTLGDYDFIMILELPTDEAAVGVLARLGSMGNVRTKTLKAWTDGGRRKNPFYRSHLNLKKAIKRDSQAKKIRISEVKNP